MFLISEVHDFAPDARLVRAASGADPFPKSWWASVKFDGRRAVWDAESRRLLTRTGKEMPYPPGWDCRLGTVSLDGELTAGDSREASGVFGRTVARADEWQAVGVTFHVFDAYDPHQRLGPYEQRMLHVATSLRNAQCGNNSVPPWVEIVKMQRVKSMADARALFERVTQRGDEGIVLRAPGSLYETGRTGTIVKMKREDEADFVVSAAPIGKQGKVWTLEVVWPRYPHLPAFRITGLAGDQRTPGFFKPGDTVTCLFNGLSAQGIPLHARIKASRSL